MDKIFIGVILSGIFTIYIYSNYNKKKKINKKEIIEEKDKELLQMENIS